jgi:hypothetical protein
MCRYRVASIALLACLGTATCFAEQFPRPTLYVPAGGEQAALVGDVPWLIVSSPGVSIWDANTGESVPFATREAAFVIASDGQTVVTGSFDGFIRRWRVADLSLIQETKPKNTRNPMVTGVDVSDDGTVVAALYSDGIVRIWDVVGEAFLAQLEDVDAFDLSADGQLLATPNGLWDIGTGFWATRIGVQGHTNVWVSPDGTRLLTSDRRGSGLFLWDAATGEELATLIGSRVKHVAFSPDGNTLATAWGIWDVRSGERIQDSPALRGPTAFAPGGDLLANGAFISQMASGRPVVLLPVIGDAAAATLVNGEADAVAFSPDGRYFASGPVLYEDKAGTRQSGMAVWRISGDIRAEARPQQGAEIIVDIVGEGIEELYGYELLIGYDNTRLQALDVLPGDLLERGGGSALWQPLVDDSQGEVALVGVRLSPGEIDGSGTLATITFQARMAGVTPLLFRIVEPVDVEGRSFLIMPHTAEVNPHSDASMRVTTTAVLTEDGVLVTVEALDAVNDHGYSVTNGTSSQLLEQLEGKWRVEGASVPESGVLAQYRYRIWGTDEVTFLPTVQVFDALGIAADAEAPEASIAFRASPPTDINKDYEVNIADLVILAQAFGKNLPGRRRPDPDVTGDDTVDIHDFVAVARDFGSVYSPDPDVPMAAPRDQAIATEDMPTAAINLLAAHGIQIAPVIPERTSLLPNYPNPFNPETWIPFDLADASEVTIHIYDTAGMLVRRFDLGSRSPGAYHTRSDAARWDGRNEQGELVGSGVYLCEIHAGGHREVRRMTVRQ